MRQKALIIGIDRYPYLGSLKSPAKDAEAIASLFQKSSSMPWEVQRWPPVLPNGTVNDDLVTEDGLSEVIRDLFCPKSGDYPDTALLFFSGHGHRNDQKEVFLATSDTNRQDQWGICLNKLHQLLPQSQVKRQIIWLDCCHAGELINFDWTEEKWKKWSAEGDRFLVAACAAYNKAYTVDGHGLLTRVLLEALDPQQEPEDKWICSLRVESFIEDSQALKNQIPVIQRFGKRILFWRGKKIKKEPLTQSPIALEEIQNLAPLNNSPAVPEARNVNSSEKLDESSLERAFLKLDYQAQEKLFKDFFNREPRGCFLIHGRFNCGQGLLLTRLIQQTYHSTTSHKITIDLSSNSISLSRLLKDIGKRVGVQSGLAEEVAQGIYRQWQKSNVIIVLKSVNSHPPESLQTIINFWCTLDNFFKDMETSDYSYSLLMFLVDYSGCLQLQNINCVDKLEGNWQPKALVRLPKLPESFGEYVLSDWLSEHLNIFPRPVRKKLRTNISSILQGPHNFPEDILEKICGKDFCNCDWHQIKPRLKI